MIFLAGVIFTLCFGPFFQGLVLLAAANALIFLNSDGSPTAILRIFFSLISPGLAGGLAAAMIVKLFPESPYGLSQGSGISDLQSRSAWLGALVALVVMFNDLSVLVSVERIGVLYNYSPSNFIMMPKCVALVLTILSKVFIVASSVTVSIGLLLLIIELPFVFFLNAGSLENLPLSYTFLPSIRLLIIILFTAIFCNYITNLFILS